VYLRDHVLHELTAAPLACHLVLTLNNNSQTCTWRLQVPLGTVIHKVAPAVKSEDHYHEEGEPFTFQQHWVGARDYVSSDEESEDGSSADEKDAKADPNLEVIMEEACHALTFQWQHGMDTSSLHHQHHFHHCDCCKLSQAVLCCAVLCCAVLCCAVLCCAVLCCAVLCCAAHQFCCHTTMLLRLLYGCCCRYTLLTFLTPNVNTSWFSSSSCNNFTPLHTQLVQVQQVGTIVTP